ncbi:hypothetical protein Q644_22910 [Brucella intermedia 229E]|uniref:Uncharacterized protein n=1 Tax=Brucella intermedia 229E TaxID=1337887 RepID=U4V943_9HYPH|nr:hypothetical protein Q644_22910 [Brucella intermedia 229E]
MQRSLHQSAPPETGPSSMKMDLAAKAEAMARVASGEIVLMSM